jgi:hypothetical protein
MKQVEENMKEGEKVQRLAKHIQQVPVHKQH